MDLIPAVSTFLHFFFFFGNFRLTPGSDGLKSIRLEAPAYVREGEDVILTCHYDIDTRSVYAIKWYHGPEEFYRYLPKESPPRQVFSKEGINVNESFSNDRQVVLTNTTRLTSGKFKCSVSAETTFKTLEDAQEIAVVVVGYDSPKLYLDQVTYSQGDTAIANCTIDRTSPPINITWFINGVPIPSMKVRTSLKPDPRDPSLTSTISSFTFLLPQTSSLIRLKCTGTLYDIYDMSSEMPIGLKPRRMSMISTNPDTLSRINATFSSNSAHTFCLSIWFHLLLAQLTCHLFN